MFEENRDIEPTLESSSGLIVSLDSHQDLTIEEALIINKLQHEDIPIDPVIQHPQQKNVDITLIRSTRERRLAISSDYIVYLQEYNFDISVEDNPIMFSQAMGGSKSTLWYNAMQDEMDSMAHNQV